MTELPTIISSNLKGLRKARGWSLDKTAQETGVSKAMLGQIERGESSPTIATLWKIASGFDVSFSSFIQEMMLSPDKAFQAAKRPKQLHPADENIRVETIFPYDHQLKFEVFLIELLPNCQHLSPAHQEGVIEHIIVLEGKMQVLDNNQWNTLKEGEGFKFTADKPHGYQNTTNSIAKFHNIIHYPASS